MRPVEVVAASAISFIAGQVFNGRVNRAVCQAPVGVQPASEIREAAEASGSCCSFLLPVLLAGVALGLWLGQRLRFEQPSARVERVPAAAAAVSSASPTVVLSAAPTTAAGSVLHEAASATGRTEYFQLDEEHPAFATHRPRRITGKCRPSAELPLVPVTTA